MRAAAQGVELEYETFGDRNDPALLLIADGGHLAGPWRE
jgi:hypothetical protein